MNIELLYFDDCPSWQSALANLQAALSEEKLHLQVCLTKVRDTEEAQSRGFLGSPSIHVGGADLWPEEGVSYSWGCRVYPTPEGLKGWPTIQMIRERLASLVSSSREV
jgi:hypothetical protein